VLTFPHAARSFSTAKVRQQDLLRYALMVTGTFFHEGAPGPGSVVEKLRAAWERYTAEVLRLRATSAVSHSQSVRRSAQDDESVEELTERRPLCGSRGAPQIPRLRSG
jgi:hypothetical protein